MEAWNQHPEQEEQEAKQIDQAEEKQEEKTDSQEDKDILTKNRIELTISKQEYETLLNRVHDIEGVVEKARGFGLFFRSNKLKGQDQDSSNVSAKLYPPMKPINSMRKSP